MLNTRGLTGRYARTGRTTHRASAGLMIGGAILGAGLFVAGCSAGGASSVASSSGMAGRSAAGEAAAAPAPVNESGGFASGSFTAGQSGSTTVKLAPAGGIVYTAQLTVRARNVGSGAAKAAQIAEAVGGYVSNENISANPAQPAEATTSVTLKIPVTSYLATLGQLESDLGTQLSVQQQAQDVTEQVADVNSQVTSDEAAIAQLRALLSHAGSVSGLLSVQNQINAEESSLESMQAQQRALSDETSYATVSLTILGPKAKPPVHHVKAPPSLAGGLGAGWRALRIAVSWTLAFLGALAPFAAVLAVAAYVVYRGRRWILRRRQDSAAGTS